MQLVFDIETDGLLHEMATCHMIVCQDVATNKIYKFTNVDDTNMSIEDGLRFLSNATVLIGHNIINFDLPALKKLFGWKPNESTALIDTWLMSMVLSYQRPHKHGLGGWGQSLGFSKQDNSQFNAEGWKIYHPEMLDYCIQDVKLNTLVYRKLLEELDEAIKINPLIKKGLRVEHDIAEFNATVFGRGWKLDTDRAHKNLRIMNKHMSKIESIIEPKLGTMINYIDKEPKEPKYTKAGWYTATSARLLTEYFKYTVLPEDAVNKPPIFPGQKFQRSETVKVKLGNMEQVKEWLTTIGWKPDDWNVKKVGYQWIRTGPKLTSTSLAKLGRIGKLIDRYYTIKNRRSVIEGWLESAVEGRVKGNMWTIGTPSFRCRHEGIVNLPAVSAPYGRMLRSLFIADEGTVLVGADSAGNQLRGLCHYVNDEDYTNIVVNGDQHQRNADILECSRPIAKSFLYAILFGAGDAKLGQTLGGISNATKGKLARQRFMASLPGFGNLVERLKNVFNNYGAIPALDGRKVFVRSAYQVLNYLLQSAEGITCKAAVSFAMEKIKNENLRAEPRIFYHDEQCWQAHPDDADRVGEILKESFKEAPKWFGVTCMDGGDYVKGNNYAEVH